MVKREKHIWHLNFFSVQQSSWQLLYPYGRSWPRTKKGNKVETYSYKIKPAHANAHSFILIILCYGIVLLNHEKRNNDLDSLSIKDMVEEQSRISKVSFKNFESFKKNLFRILKNWKAVKSQRWRRWEQNFTKVTFIWLMCFQLLEIKACKEKCGREFEAIQKQVWQRGCLGTLVDNTVVWGCGCAQSSSIGLGHELGSAVWVKLQCCCSIYPEWLLAHCKSRWKPLMREFWHQRS